MPALYVKLWGDNFATPWLRVTNIVLTVRGLILCSQRLEW